MFDHEKMSEKDQIRYAEAMQASIDAAKAKKTEDFEIAYAKMLKSKVNCRGIAQELSPQHLREKQRKALKAQDLAFPPNCGAPLNPEAVKAGLTWCAEIGKYVPHQALGATVTKPPEGWEDLFGRGERYAYRAGLKVVSIVYDWKLFN